MAEDITTQEASERVLQESENVYRTIVETAWDGIIASDENGVITYVNQRMAEMLGYTSEEMLGKSGFDFLDDEARARITDRRREYKPGASEHYEVRFMRKDGSDLWVLSTFTPTFDSQSQYAGGLSILSDITERKRTNEELRESERRYRSLLDTAQEGIWIMDNVGIITYFNQRAAQMLGYTVEELIGRPGLDMVDEKDREFLNRRSEERSPGVQMQFDWRFTRKDGSDLWVIMALTPQYGPKEEYMGLLVMVTDITDRKRFEEELLESERRYRALIENSADAIALFGADGSILYGSPATTRVLGYALNEFVDRNAFELIHEDDHPFVSSRLTESVQNPGVGVSVQYRILHKNGTWRLLEGVFTNLLAEPSIGAIVNNYHDITERKQAEETQRAMEAADEANRAKSEFLSRMSHELRTPLNSILGFAQLLEMENLSPAQTESARFIRKAGDHLLDLINEVLEIARIEAGRLSLSSEPISLDNLLADTVQLVKMSATQRSISIHLDTTGDLYVIADHQRLKQVMLNLLSNAIKYNKEGGTVRLTYERHPNRRVRISVADTGYGISQAELPRLFSPFERLSAEHTEVEGTGLGLTLSKHLVEAMGGAMGVESAVGQGSIFWLDLDETDPAISMSSDTVTGTLTQTMPDTRPLTILYIEDNLANMALIERILARWPQSTLIPAMKGRLGVELAHQHHPDLILLDLHLPDIQGDEALRELKADPATAHIPIIMVSADASPRQISRLLSMGALDYITKPLNVAEFIRIIQGIAQEKGRPQP